MPEVTENYIRVPNPKHSCESKDLRTIDISKSKGIKALYCLDHKKIRTYLFDKEKWSMAEAKKWVSENATQIDEVFKPQFAKAFIEKAQGEDGGLGLCVISSDTVDRHGDQIDSKGWEFRNFRKNPILLWSHNSGMDDKRPSIGKVKDVYEKDGKVYFVPQFDMEDGFAADIHRKYKNGFLNAFSVGFLPLEWTESETGYNFVKQEALEFSAVNVPANPEALVVLREAGFDVKKDWDGWNKEDDGNEGLVGEDPTKEEEEDESKWEESFETVKAKMAEVLSAKELDEEKYKKIASLYKKFGRIPPEKKHFEFAVNKVVEGKLIEKPKRKKKVSDSELLLQVVRLIAIGKGVATPTSIKVPAEGGGEEK